MAYASGSILKLLADREVSYLQNYSQIKVHSYNFIINIHDFMLGERWFWRAEKERVMSNGHSQNHALSYHGQTGDHSTGVRVITISPWDELVRINQCYLHMQTCCAWLQWMWSLCHLLLLWGIFGPSHYLLPLLPALVELWPLQETTSGMYIHSNLTTFTYFLWSSSTHNYVIIQA